MELRDKQLETLNQTLRLGATRAAATLGDLLGGSVVVSAPRLKPPTSGLVESSHADAISAVRTEFYGSASGSFLVAYALSDDPRGAADTDVWPSGAPPAVQAGADLEIANVLTNHCLESLADLLGCELESDLPVRWNLPSPPDGSDPAPVILAELELRASSRDLQRRFELSLCLDDPHAFKDLMSACLEKTLA